MSANKLVEAFTEPFDKSLIKKGKRGLFNVSPADYVDRIAEAMPLGYSVEESFPIFHEGTVTVNTTVTFEGPAGKVVSSANGAHLVEDSVDGVADAIKSAASDGLKRALMKWGLGTHLYHDNAASPGADDEEEPERPVRKPATKPAARKPEPETEEEEEEEKPAPRGRYASKKPASSGGGDWSSKREKFTYPMGKNKGTSYPDLESSFLVWAQASLDPDDEKYGESNAKILKCVEAEIKYRKANDEWNPDAGKRKSNKPTRKRSVAEDEDDI